MEKKMSALVLAGAMAAGCATTRPEMAEVDEEVVAILTAISDKMMHRDALATIDAENEGRQPDGSFVCCATALNEELAKETATGCVETLPYFIVEERRTNGVPITYSTHGDGVDVKLSSTIHDFRRDHATKYFVCARATRKGVSRALGE